MSDELPKNLTEFMNWKKASEEFELDPQLSTVGDLRKLIKIMQSEKRSDKGIEGLKDVGMGVLADLVPGGGTALSLAQTLKGMYTAPDDKKTNTMLDKLNVDDEVAMIVDDTVEENFLNQALKAIEGLSDDSPMPNINKELSDWLKSKYDARTVDGWETNESLLRKYIRELIVEKDDSAGPGERYIYRGMKIDMGSAGLAAQIRKIAQKKPAGISEQEAGRFIMGMLNNEEIGESWSISRDVAANFADVWEATNRGSILHVMFTGKIPNEFGYDPTTTGEEPPMFEDESEVRIPKGEEIFISNVAVFIADKKGGKNWMKFKPVAFSLGSVKA